MTGETRRWQDGFESLPAGVRPLYECAFDVLMNELVASPVDVVESLVEAEPRTLEEFLAYLPGAEERLVERLELARVEMADPVTAEFRQRLIGRTAE